MRNDDVANRRAAIDVWKLVLALDPDDTDTTAPAAAALEELYTETGDIAGLVKILGMQVRWAPAAMRRSSLIAFDLRIGTSSEP